MQNLQRKEIKYRQCKSAFYSKNVLQTYVRFSHGRSHVTKFEKRDLITQIMTLICVHLVTRANFLKKHILHNGLLHPLAYHKVSEFEVTFKCTN